MASLLALFGLAALGMSLFVGSEDDESLDQGSDGLQDDETPPETNSELVTGGTNEEMPDVIFADHGQAVWSNDNFETYAGSDMPTDAPDSSAVLVTNDQDAQVIDASAMDQSIVYSGEGDRVIGSDNTGNEGVFVSISSGGATVEGGDSNGIFLSDGDMDEIYGEGGNDLIIGGNQSALLDGGAGDDTIYSSYETFFAPTGMVGYQELVDTAADTLVGGAGDDVLIMASGDEASGGAGKDTIIGFGSDMAISDFEWGVDELHISVPVSTLPISLPGNSPAEIAALFEVDVTGDRMHLKLGEHLLVELPDTSNAVVGFQLAAGPDETLYDIGSGLEIEKADVIVDIHGIERSFGYPFSI